MEQPGFEVDDINFGYLYTQLKPTVTVFDYSLNSKVYSPKIRFKLKSGHTFYRNIGLRAALYSVKDKMYYTDLLNVYPSEMKSYLGDSHIDVYFGFSDELAKDTYNIIIYIDEHTLRDGSSTMIPEKSEVFIAPEVWLLERNFEVTEVCPITK